MQPPRRETRCCSSLARSCSVQAAHHREEKSPFVPEKWAEKSVTPVLSRRPDSSKGRVWQWVPCSAARARLPPSPPSGVCHLLPGPKRCLSIPTVACARGLLSHSTPHHTTMALGEQPPCTAQLGFHMATESHCPLLRAGLTYTSPTQWPWALLPDLPVPGSVPPPHAHVGKSRGNIRAQELVAGKAVPHTMLMALVPPFWHSWGHEWHTVHPPARPIPQEPASWGAGPG